MVLSKLNLNLDPKKLPKMTLKAFVKKVNDISHKECQKTNEAYDKGESLFGAEHIDYPESLLKHYYGQGLTPEETLLEMEYEHLAEVHAESMCS